LVACDELIARGTHVHKKGYFFVIDAFIGSAIIFVALFIILNSDVKQTSLQYDYSIAEDYSTFMMNTKLRDINNDYIRSITNNGTNNMPIQQIDYTLMEQIDEFYNTAFRICGDITCTNQYLSYASNLVQNISEPLIPPKYGFSYTMFTAYNNQTLYSRQGTTLNSAKIVLASRKITFLQINASTMFGPALVEVKVWLK
jgi:hypothetical protein